MEEGLNEELWEVVATAAGMAQANLITGRLASDGIPARLSYEAAGSIYAITIDGLGEVRILVPVPAVGQGQGGPLSGLRKRARSPGKPTGSSPRSGES